MKKHILSKYVLALVVILAALGLALSNISRSRARSIAMRTGSSDDRRTLREKAREARKFVGSEAPNMAARYSDLDQLVRHSRAVVVGSAQQNVCRLSFDGRRSTIDYVVKIEYAFKGNLKPNSTITVSLPGGLVAFPDGSSAEIGTSWFKKMQEGTAYLLFLSDGEGGSSFVTTGQAQGVWEIPTTADSRTVKAHTGIINDPMWKYQNMDVSVFLREVRKAVKNDNSN
jgi:hypothetical protein